MNKEMWRWMKLRLDTIDQQRCSSCDKRSLDYVYTPYEEQDKRGMLWIWCTHCLAGIMIGKMDIPLDDKVAPNAADIPKFRMVMHIN